MLQVFRKHAYSYVTRILLILLGGIFALFFGSVGGFFSRIQPIAYINCHQYLFGLITLPGCHEVMSDDIQREATDIRRTFENRYGKDSASMLQAVNLQQMAVEAIVEQELIIREARRLGVQVSEEDLAKTIESQTAFQVDGRFNVELYERTLRNNDLEPAAYETSTREKMVTSILQRMLYNGLSVSNADARAQFERYAERLNLAYIEFPYSSFTTGIHPTDAQISKFYNENREAFREPELVKLTFVRYDPKVLAGSLIPSASDIEQNYERNLKAIFTHPAQVHARHILISVPSDASPQQKAAGRAKAEELLQKLRAGADFTAFAKQYSDDPSNRDKGGDLGYFSRGEMVKPFEDAVFSLKAGQMAVVETQYGYHIVKVEAVDPAHTDTVEQARPQIVAAIREKAGTDTAQLDLEQDRAAALEGRDLGDIAKRRGLVVVTTPYISQKEQIKDNTDGPKLVDEAFKMSAGEIRSVVGGSAPYLVKLVDHKASRIPGLSEIKDRVRDALVKVTADNKAHDAAAAILKQMKAPGDFDRLAVANHLDIHTTGEFMRATRSVPGIGQFPEVTEAAAAVPSPPGTINQVLENGGNSFIFKVLTRTPPGADQWKMQGPEFTAQLLQQRREHAWTNFVDELRRRALVVVRQDLLGGNSETPARM
jgi:peptidyl-prolyl cis-trans isomerase D